MGDTRPVMIFNGAAFLLNILLTTPWSLVILVYRNGW